MTALPSTRSSVSGIQEQHVDCKEKKLSATAMAKWRKWRRAYERAIGKRPITGRRAL